MLIYAGCPEAEDELIRGDHCPECGGSWNIVKRDRTFLRAQPTDEITVRCRSCGYEHTFSFDIKGFMCKC